MMKPIPMIMILWFLFFLSVIGGCKQDDNKNRDLLIGSALLFELQRGAIPGAGDRKTFTVDGKTFNLRYVPGKNFLSGLADSDAASVGSGFWMAETEVTYDLWYTVYTWATSGSGAVGAGQYVFAQAGREGANGAIGLAPGPAGQEPVTTINWRDAMVWTNALTEWFNARGGASLEVVYTSDAGYSTPIRNSADNGYGSDVDTAGGHFDNPFVNPNARGFRLPASGEWELAARYIDDANNDGDIEDPGEYYPGTHISGDITNPYNTSTVFGDYAWYWDNCSSSTQPVGTRAANALGLYDLSGNVHEWNFDWYTVDSFRVKRGGSWNNTSNALQIGITTPGNPFDEDNKTSLRFGMNGN